MTLGLINANPVVHAKKERIARSEDFHGDDAVDPLEIYDILFLIDHSQFANFLSLTRILAHFVRDIRDPEHPYSLEQLSVLSEESITVDEKLGRILITFTPTIQHCSMATVIGLCLRVKLKHFFPPHYKVDIKVSPGSHANEESVNKQLNDKERVAAALENPNLRQLVDECLDSSEF
ncbi:Protein AE7-like 1, partial [Cucurbita argyrosperma subsp. sororia]